LGYISVGNSLGLNFDHFNVTGPLS